MIKVSLKEAEEHLGELIGEVAAGQEVVITSDGGPAVRLVLAPQREAWLEENREAIKVYNDHVAQHGVFSAGLRDF